MKRSSNFPKLLSITFALALICFNAVAQTASVVTPAKDKLMLMEKIDGNALIESMVNEKRDFIKNKNSFNPLKAAHLPKAKHILSRTKPTVIIFDGLEYVVEKNNVIEIVGLNLSQSVLAQISEKIAFLDQVQYDYAEKANQENLYANADVATIRNLDKWYLQTLKILTTTVNDIASITKKPDASNSFAFYLVRMPQPNVGLMTERNNTGSLVQLAK
ncbi:hypothetical protein [Pedobacter sandarakinus]|uniref:hypothetical protein n=1 Tax=Pedobacter sandarakinus TaxID=353156 RepID=UPI002245F9A4|nr:hypothetical protein [Pedobacter sandarakinus]MCX2573634.1 hypothetical protein [Pedobacter sandarakinus]